MATSPNKKIIKGKTVMMTNMLQLLRGTENEKLFAKAILDFKNSQGFYSRLYNCVQEMDGEQFAILRKELAQQNFGDVVDVVLWLES